MLAITEGSRTMDFRPTAITSIRAADRVRTGDLHLGKVSRYLLRHNRISLPASR
jgi:hypothetical protein